MIGLVVSRAAPVSARRRRLSISPSNVISSHGQLCVSMAVTPPSSSSSNWIFPLKMREAPLPRLTLGRGEAIHEVHASVGDDVAYNGEVAVSTSYGLIPRYLKRLCNPR
jgi:hypothetical protein